MAIWKYLKNFISGKPRGRDVPESFNRTQPSEPIPTGVKTATGTEVVECVGMATRNNLQRGFKFPDVSPVPQKIEVREVSRVVDHRMSSEQEEKQNDDFMAESDMEYEDLDPLFEETNRDDDFELIILLNGR